MAKGPESLAERMDSRRARRANMLRYRHKEGFDRLGIVLFAAFALAFGLLWLFVSEPYALPAPDTAAGAAIDTEIAEGCRDDLEEALVMLCRERILGGYRWAYYSDRLAVDRYGWLYAVVLVAAAVGAAWPVTRWVVAGFRKETPKPWEA